jgi:hypothetical protein
MIGIGGLPTVCPVSPMSNSLFTKFPEPTAEQLAQIAVYQEKWRLLATRTDRVVHPDCEAAIHLAYKQLGWSRPRVEFIQSPRAAIERLHTIIVESNYTLQNCLAHSFDKALKQELTKQTTGCSSLTCYPSQLNMDSIAELRKQLDQEYYSHVSALFRELLWQDNRIEYSTFRTQAWHYSQAYIAPELLAITASYLDWLCNCLNCNHDPILWSILESILVNCGWIFPFEKFCLVVDRPTHLQFNETFQLHAEAQPAITFADGFAIYVHRGIKVHERYGKIPPKDWDPNWYTDEKDYRVRSMLLQELDASRVKSNWLLSEHDHQLRVAIVQKLNLKIQHLSNEQLQSLEQYRQKWRNIALNTEPIDPEKVATAIRQFYEFHGLIKAPIILIASSPAMGRKLIKQQNRNQKSRRSQLRKFAATDDAYKSFIIDRLWRALSVQVSEPVAKQLRERLSIKRSWDLEAPQNWWQSSVWAQPETICDALSLVDFCISTLGCVYDAELWETIQVLFTECGWFYPTDRFCVVCDRPRQIFVDEDDKLHREDGPAIIYADGYRQHARHGLRPKAYFKAHREKIDAYINNYKTTDEAQIRFEWNGKHASDFDDKNMKFRQSVRLAVLANLDKAPIELIRDLFKAETEFSVEAWSIVAGVEKLAEAMLRRGGEQYLDDYLIGRSRSFDAHCGSYFPIDIGLAQRLLIALKLRLEAEPDSPKAELWRSGQQAFEDEIDRRQSQ